MSQAIEIGVGSAALPQLYSTMLLIRAVEENLAKLFADGMVPGFIHLSIGQEAVAAGVTSTLSSCDTLTTTHRGHGHVIARGLDLQLFFKEVLGRAGGICGGRGGSMHVADVRLGILGANGIVAAGIPIAAGSAVAHSVRRTGGIAVAFFGDGAMAEGVFHESLNLATLLRLPLLLVCENNGWSEFSPTSAQFAPKLDRLAEAFAASYRAVDGNDVAAVARECTQLVATVRAGGGPAILECHTRRVRGHYEGDPQKYRTGQDLQESVRADPIERAASALLQQGCDAAWIERAQAEAKERVAAAIQQAVGDSQPDFDAALADVYSPDARGVCA